MPRLCASHSQACAAAAALAPARCRAQPRSAGIRLGELLATHASQRRAFVRTHEMTEVRAHRIGAAGRATTVSVPRPARVRFSASPLQLASRQHARSWLLPLPRTAHKSHSNSKMSRDRKPPPPPLPRLPCRQRSLSTTSATPAPLSPAYRLDERTRTITDSMHAYSTEREDRLLAVQEAWRHSRRCAGEVASLRTAVAQEPDNLGLRFKLNEAERRRREAKTHEDLAKQALSSPTMQGALSSSPPALCQAHADGPLFCRAAGTRLRRRRTGRVEARPTDVVPRSGRPAASLPLAVQQPYPFAQRFARPSSLSTTDPPFLLARLLLDLDPFLVSPSLARPARPPRLDHRAPLELGTPLRPSPLPRLVPGAPVPRHVAPRHPRLLRRRGARPDPGRHAQPDRLGGDQDALAGRGSATRGACRPRCADQGVGGSGRRAYGRREGRALAQGLVGRPPSSLFHSPSFLIFIDSFLSSVASLYIARGSARVVVVFRRFLPSSSSRSPRVTSGFAFSFSATTTGLELCVSCVVVLRSLLLDPGALGLLADRAPVRRTLLAVRHRALAALASLPLSLPPPHLLLVSQRPHARTSTLRRPSHLALDLPPPAPPRLCPPRLVASHVRRIRLVRRQVVARSQDVPRTDRGRAAQGGAGPPRPGGRASQDPRASLLLLLPLLLTQRESHG